MPVSVFEGDETSAADSSDWLDAGGAALGEQLAEAICAVGLLVARGEPLAGQRGVAVSAREALPVPGLVLVRHAARRDDLVTLDATGSELLLVAGGAVNLLLARDEALGADSRPAHHAAEALLVPLARLVLHLLITCTEDLAAAVAAGGELSVIARPAVDLLHLAAELLVHQRQRALATQEALLVPMLVFVRQVLRIDADERVAVVACVSKHALVALGAVGVVVFEHIALAGQRLVALPAAEVLGMPLLRHRLRVLAADAVPLPPSVGGLHDGRGLFILPWETRRAGLSRRSYNSLHLLRTNFLNTGRHFELVTQTPPPM